MTMKEIEKLYGIYEANDDFIETLNGQVFIPVGPDEWEEE